MTPARGPGHHFGPKNYGKVICPQCQAEAAKLTYNQRTCGRASCQREQNLAAGRKRRGR